MSVETMDVAELETHCKNRSSPWFGRKCACYPSRSG